MTKYTSPQLIADALRDSRETEIDYRITPDLIIDAIRAMPSLSHDDASRIIESIAETFQMNIDFSLE